MGRFIDWLERNARARVIVPTLLVGVLSIVYLYAYAVPRLESHSPGALPLDTLPSYTPDEAYRVISLYSEDARSFYVFNAFTADVVVPVLMGLAIALMNLALLRRVVRPGSWWRSPLLAAGIIGVVADLLENALLSVVVSRFPERLDGLVRVASLTTMTKRIAVFSTLGALLVLGLAALIRLVVPREARERA